MKIEWNKEGVEINSSEYSWLVYLEDNNIEVGFYYFKHKGKQNTGTYNDLFKEGQVSIFRNQINISIDEPDKPTINLIDGDIVLKLEDRKLLDQLFNNRNKSVNFWILSNGNYPRVCKASTKEIK